MFQNNSKGMKKCFKKTGVRYIYSFILLREVRGNLCLYDFQGVIPKVLSTDLVLIPLKSPVKLLLAQKDSIDVGCFSKTSYYLVLAEAFFWKNWQRLKENLIGEQTRVTTKSFSC